MAIHQVCFCSHRRRCVNRKVPWKKKVFEIIQWIFNCHRSFSYMIKLILANNIYKTDTETLLCNVYKTFIEWDSVTYALHVFCAFLSILSKSWIHSYLSMYAIFKYPWIFKRPLHESILRPWRWQTFLRTFHLNIEFQVEFQRFFRTLFPGFRFLDI